MLAVELKDVYCEARHKEIIHGISLQIRQGEAMALLGPNGAGKTTLIRLICGLGPCSKGNIFIMEHDVTSRRDIRIKSLLGLVPQENDIERELTIRTSMVCYAQLYGVPNSDKVVDDTIKNFGMETWADKKPDQISGGMHRRAMIARAAIPEPKILILDEPSVGLDPELRQEIWQQIEVLKKNGITIILTTHYLGEAEKLCDRIALIKEGRLLAVDTVQGIKACADNAVTLEDAYLSIMQRQEENF